jgi:nucleolar GTP-binding protein
LPAPADTVGEKRFVPGEGGSDVSFRGIPTILTPQELMDKAFGRAAKIEKPDRDRYHRQRKTTLARLEAVRNILSDSLERYIRRFPSLDQLPPYHQELIELLIGKERFRIGLARVDRARKNVVSVLNRAMNEIATELDVPLVLQVQRDAYGRVSSMLRGLEEPLAELARFRETLRRLPEVAPDLFTVVVAGYPNVGKSSLIRALTDAEPEVAAYPFTTKAALVGHMEIDVAEEERKRRAATTADPAPEERRERRWGGPRLLRVQIIDTPGLLDRPEEERNPIEKQAALAVRHLADLVLFLRDPTGHCGYPLDAQANLLAEVRRVVPDVRLVVIETKADLGDPQQSGPSNDALMQVSTLTGDGMSDLRALLVAEAMRPRQDAKTAAYLRGELQPPGQGTHP